MTIAELTESIFINGTWQEVDPNNVESIYNPATLEKVTSVAYGGAEETNRAIEAATKAFSTWSEMTGRERGRILYKTRSEEHTSELQSRFDLVCRLLLEKKNK